MKIGILGTGDVGQTLGTGLLALGHEVMLGSRDVANDKLREWVAKNGTRATGGTFAQAAAFGELAILATAWPGAENALQLAGVGNLAGKTVMDATNPFVFGPGGLSLALGTTDSGGEQVQRWLPGANVVKAFNSVGKEHMVKPHFPGGEPSMFICGNNMQAKLAVASLCESLGWQPVDMGDITAFGLIEPIAAAWITLAMRTGARNHAFKVLTM